jgi:predicted ester cyclase
LTAISTQQAGYAVDAGQDAAVLTALASDYSKSRLQSWSPDKEDFMPISETVKLFYQAVSSNQPDLLDQVLAPDWQDAPLNPGQGPGRDGFKPLIGGFYKTIADLKVTNDDIIESGDKVVVRSTIEGTQAGDFAGFPSRGRPFKIMAIDIHQFNDGKVVKTWHIEDWLSGLFRMGAFQK